MKKVAEVLEGLREEERRLSVELSGVRRAIAALEEVMGNGPERSPVTAPEPGVAPPDAGVPAPATTPGPYATASLYEAAAIYLAGADGPKTAREIAEALKAGGYSTRAKDFTATVRTMLLRDLSAKLFGIYPTETGGRWFAREGLSDE